MAWVRKVKVDWQPPAWQRSWLRWVSVTGLTRRDRDETMPPAQGRECQGGSMPPAWQRECWSGALPPAWQKTCQSTGQGQKTRTIARNAHSWRGIITCQCPGPMNVPWWNWWWLVKVETNNLINILMYTDIMIIVSTVKLNVTINKAYRATRKSLVEWHDKWQEQKHLDVRTKSGFQGHEWCNAEARWRTEKLIWKMTTNRKSKKETGKKWEMKSLPMTHPSGY